jgi:L-rhamnose isomerase
MKEKLISLVMNTRARSIKQRRDVEKLCAPARRSGFHPLQAGRRCRGARAASGRRRVPSGIGLPQLPVRATGGDELRLDMTTASGDPPAKKSSTSTPVTRKRAPRGGPDAYTVELFPGCWTGLRRQKLGLDINPTYFSPPPGGERFTLSCADKACALSEIEHGNAAAKSPCFGKASGLPAWSTSGCPTAIRMCPTTDPPHAPAHAGNAGSIFRLVNWTRRWRRTRRSPSSRLGVEEHTVGSHEFMLSYR